MQCPSCKEVMLVYPDGDNCCPACMVVVAESEKVLAIEIMDEVKNYPICPNCSSHEWMRSENMYTIEFSCPNCGFGFAE